MPVSGALVGLGATGLGFFLDLVTGNVPLRFDKSAVDLPLPVLDDPWMGPRLVVTRPGLVQPTRRPVAALLLGPPPKSHGHGETITQSVCPYHAAH